MDRGRSTERITQDIETLSGPEYTLSDEAIRRYAYTQEYRNTLDWFTRELETIGFDVEEDPVPTVVHHVELSLVPNWVGRPQRRTAVLEGDRLRLTAQPLEVAGRTTIPRLTWRRG